MIEWNVWAYVAIDPGTQPARRIAHYLESF